MSAVAVSLLPAAVYAAQRGKTVIYDRMVEITVRNDGVLEVEGKTDAL